MNSVGRWSGSALMVLALTGAVLVGALLSASGKVAVVPALLVTLFPVLAWRRADFVPLFLVTVSCLIEQFPGDATGTLTGRIPLFNSLSAGLGLPGVYLTPMELLLGAWLAIWLLREVAAGRAHWPRSPQAKALATLLVIALIAEVVGLAKGGNFTFALWEFRPWLYLGIAYLVGASSIGSDRARLTVLWAFVIGTGVKGLQGLVNAWTNRNVVPRPESILAHEEAFFFALFIVLVLLLWSLPIDRGLRRLRLAASWLLPAVIVADLVNYRRTAWLILAAGMVIVAAVRWVRQPTGRRRLIAVSLAIVIGTSLYTAGLWNNDGILGQPARAIRSGIAPTDRDRESNRYRQLEDANLMINIGRSPVFGLGFGIPIDYSTVPIVDLRAQNALLAYVPHNDVLWVWMRMGVIGLLALLVVVGLGFLGAARAVRLGSPSQAVLAAMVLVALAGYLVQGAYDYGFFWFRIALFTGLLMGAMERIPIPVPVGAARSRSFPALSGVPPRALMRARAGAGTGRRVPDAPADPPKDPQKRLVHVKLNTL